MKMEVEKLVEELFKKVYELERLVQEEKAELVIEDNCVPRGYYLTISRTSDKAIEIERGCYGQWQEVLKVYREEKEL